MRIGFIGTGHIGGTLARLFVKAGHEAAVSNSRGPDTLADLANELGERGRAMTASEAARFGEVVVVSIPFGRYRDLPAEALAGKIVADTTNYYAGRDGRFEELESGRSTSSELLQAQLAGARVVKAFNTLYFQILAEQGRPSAPLEERVVVLVAGDDPGAKATVSGLIEEIGFAPVDTGTLGEGGRKQQPGAPLYNRPVTVAQAREVIAAS
jgi:predicted dinucleotide-binding enzyme